MSREALLVLGMHRSGTSAVTGLLVRLGGQAPRTLLPRDPDNPTGYWESALFYELHERLLRAAGTRWDAYTSLDMERALSPHDEEVLIDECCRALRAEFGDATRLVLKDPRMCRFVPFWLRALAREDIDPAAVLVLRSPFEVARSLGARNGLERDLSLLIWLRHVLDAERHTRLVRRTFVRFQEIVDDWKPVADRITRDLGISWPSRSLAEEAKLNSFVNSGLRHHRDGVNTPDDIPSGLADWLRRTSGALQRLHDHDPGEGAVLAELDAVRSEFDLATSALGGVEGRMRSGFEAQVGSLRGQVASLEGQVGALQGEVGGLHGRIGELQAHAERLRAHAESLQAHLERVESEKRVLHEQTARIEALRIDLQQRVATLEKDHAVLHGDLSAARHEVKALRGSASWRVTAPLRAAYRLFR